MTVKIKWNKSGFRPPLCTYRLNWARRTSWGWWDEWDDTVLQTQDSKFEPWRSEAEHATSRSQKLPTILTFTRGWGRNISISSKPPRPGTESRALAWKAAVLTTTLGPLPFNDGGVSVYLLQHFMTKSVTVTASQWREYFHKEILRAFAGPTADRRRKSAHRRSSGCEGGPAAGWRRPARSATIRFCCGCRVVILHRGQGDGCLSVERVPKPVLLFGPRDPLTCRHRSTQPANTGFDHLLF